MKILVVDDEKLVREGLASLAQTYANSDEPEIRTAKNAYIAQEVLRNFRPDIIFVDIQMPGCSGLALIEKMRQMSFDCLVIIVSSHADFEYAQQAIRLGVTDYLLKPISPDRFKSVYQKAQKKTKNRQALQIDATALSKNIHELREQLVAGLIMEIERYDREVLKQRMLNLSMNVDQYCIGYLRQFDQVTHRQQQSATNIRNLLYEVLSPCGAVYVTCNDIGTYVVLIAFYNFLNPDEVNGKYQGILADRLGKEYFIRFSEVRSNLEDASNAYIQLLLCYQRLNLTSSIPDQADDPISHILAASHISSIVYTVVEYIAADYHTEISLETAARKVYVHPAYLSDLFKREVGENFNSFLNNYRVYKAKKMLQQVHHKIYVIANMVGFNDQRYFSTVFKRYTGLTPMEYREKHMLTR